MIKLALILTLCGYLIASRTVRNYGLTPMKRTLAAFAGSAFGAITFVIFIAMIDA